MCSFQHKWASERQLYLFVVFHTYSPSEINAIQRVNTCSTFYIPCIPGLVQTNITNSAEEKWALLDKDIEMEDSETENENGNGRTILHHTISLHYNVM